jgi:pimeloyl-ACP methyl ester carboxylesterase
LKRWPRALSLALLASALSSCSSARFYSHFVPYYFSGKAPKAECAEGPGFKYCLHRSPNGDDDASSALYFLHYANGSERSWSKIPVARVYYDEFRRRGVKPPRVVTVSFGTHWTLFDEPGPLSPEGRYPVFVGRVMPFVEGKLGAPKRRFLWGMSQGGLNAAELLLRSPGSWQAAVLSCPALYGLDLYASDRLVADFARRHGVRPKKVRSGMDLVRERVAGPEAWRREDPLDRAKTAAELPPVYIGASTEDEFGFYEGARMLAETLRETGQPVVFHEDQGSHCALDARAAAAFLAESASR